MITPLNTSIVFTISQFNVYFYSQLPVYHVMLLRVVPVKPTPYADRPSTYFHIKRLHRTVDMKVYTWSTVLNVACCN